MLMDRIMCTGIARGMEEQCLLWERELYLLEEIARACPDTQIRPSFTLVLTGPSGRIGGFLGVTAFY
jgi:hypothetical protein